MEMQGRVRELTAQRDQAVNRCVLLGGVLFEAEQKVMALEARIAELEKPKE